MKEGYYEPLCYYTHFSKHKAEFCCVSVVLQLIQFYKIQEQTEEGGNFAGENSDCERETGRARLHWGCL